MVTISTKNTWMFPNMKQVFNQRHLIGQMIESQIDQLPDANDDPTNEKEILNQQMLMLNDRLNDSLSEIQAFINTSRWKLTNLAYQI